MDKLTLRECPFCGGKAKRFTIGDEEPNNAGGDCIGCVDCGASSHVEFGRKENLVSRWNTRTTDAELERLREALRMVKLACLGTDWEARRVLGCVTRICIDAGIAEPYRALDTEQRRRAITLPHAEIGNRVDAALNGESQ